MTTAAVYEQMNASRAALTRLANGIPTRLGCGPHDREACVHYFPEGTGLLVYAWLDGAAWGVAPVVYRIQGNVITGPACALARRQR